MNNTTKNWWKQSLFWQLKSKTSINIKWLCFLVLIISLQTAKSQHKSQKDSILIESENTRLRNRHSLGASLFMLSNFFPDPADYYLLTYGYQFTEKDRVFVEFNTWKYSEPLGTYDNSDELYPGYVRSFGIGAGYQHFYWKGFYTAIQATPFLKQYYNEDNSK